VNPETKDKVLIQRGQIALEDSSFCYPILSFDGPKEARFPERHLEPSFREPGDSTETHRADHNWSVASCLLTGPKLLSQNGC